MNKTKLTVRVPKDLLENFKQFANQNDTTLTQLIIAYIKRIPPQSSFKQAPIVRRLSGILSPDINIQDYVQYIEEKYEQ